MPTACSSSAPGPPTPGTADARGPAPAVPPSTVRGRTVRGAFPDPRVRLPLPDGRVLGPTDGPEAWLEGLFDARPGAWLRRIEDRETFVWPGSDGAFVVKRYRGDLARDRWYERLRGRSPRSPGRREGENLEALAALGVGVPRVLAWFEEPGGMRSAVVMERLPASAHLRAALEACAGPEREPARPDPEREPARPDPEREPARPDPEREPARHAAERGWAAELVELVARLHDAGWYHRDLYLVHLLPSPGLHLIDVGRARREPRPRRRWFVKDLAALSVSTPPSIGAPARLRFLRDYLRRRGLAGRGELRAWARAIAAKARRLERHVPRRVDPRDGERRY